MPSAAPSSLAIVTAIVAATASSIQLGPSTCSAHLRHDCPTTLDPAELQLNDVYTKLLAHVNEERAAHGLAALCASTKLQQAAQRQSEDMAANDFLHHVGSDGSTVPSRIADAEYKWTTIAENVAAGHVDAEAVMGTLMDSTGHRMNILGDYTHFGAGYTYNPDGLHGHYWAQEFATSDSERCDETRLFAQADSFFSSYF
ncbi:unnamed protein product [Hyaloperonospora brassicae]|uniref:SCP domain-containing protein n=1 Tax=Hyaloperonospora brassicae TaxID=162125 RepID=A0AAV0TJJ3_HYABA|nr:unnamed protein product [Hyaloperonospora brassicae]